MNLCIYENTNSLQDIGIIAGTYFKLEFECYDADGSAINLTTSGAAYGCSFSLYGDEANALFVITGTQKVGEGNEHVMVIAVPSSSTVALGDCCLTYQPFITIDDNTIRPAQARIIIQAATPMTISG